MASTEVEAAKGTELEGISEEELDAISGAVTQKTKQSDIVLPLIALTQGISDAVADGLAKPGEYLNTLTKENYGNEFEFIVAGFFYGKSYRNRDEDFFGTAVGDIIPGNWPHKDAGKPFEESDDFEDRFRELVNDGTIKDWGDGPPISTTYNFVGFRPGEHEIPLRISFQRTSSGAAKKLLTLINMDRRIWDRVYGVKSSYTESNGNKFYVSEITRGAATEAEDLRPIVDLAINLKRAEENGGIELSGDESDKAPNDSAADAAKPEGGLDL